MAFVSDIEVWFAVGVCKGTSRRRPLRIEVFVFAIEVRFAVGAHNGQSRTPVPTNKAFVSLIEVRFFFLISVRKRARCTSWVS